MQRVHAATMNIVRSVRLFTKLVRLYMLVYGYENNPRAARNASEGEGSQELLV